VNQPRPAWLSDRSLLLTAALAAALLGCFLVLFYLPDSRAARAATLKLHERQAELAEKMTRVRQLPELVDRVARLKPEYVADLDRLPSDPRVADFLRQVADTLVAETIAKREVVPQAERAGPGFTELPVEIKFEATFAAVFRVLARLEALPRVSRIENLKLTAVPDGKGLMHAELKIVVFHSNPSGQENVKTATGLGKAARS
jgi:Tfp pilus assembly protein PilO